MPFEQAAAIFTTKPLNDALTRSLEDGGIPMMYKAILLSAPEEVGRAVGEVAACAEAGEPVVFHCQKGKDRTGLVAALVESVCGVPRPEIVAGYAVSGALLGGDDAKPASRDGMKPGDGVDWGLFRGSPAPAMEDTLAWLDDTYGSPSDYLAKACGFDESRQASLRGLVS